MRDIITLGHVSQSMGDMLKYKSLWIFNITNSILLFLNCVHGRERLCECRYPLRLEASIYLGVGKKGNHWSPDYLSCLFDKCFGIRSSSKMCCWSIEHLAVATVWQPCWGCTHTEIPVVTCVCHTCLSWEAKDKQRSRQPIESSWAPLPRQVLYYVMIFL